MPTTYLLDTNAFSWLARGESTHLRHFLALTGDDRIVTSWIVMGELRYGHFGIRSESRRQEIERRERTLLLRLNEVFLVDQALADRYGEIYADLSVRGFQIPMNDAWIAATALVHGCVLISSDRHFDRVTGLTRIDWSL